MSKPTITLVEYYKTFVDEYGSEPLDEDLERWFQGLLEYVQLDVTVMMNEHVIELNCLSDEIDIHTRKKILPEFIRMCVHYLENQSDKSNEVIITQGGEKKYVLRLDTYTEPVTGYYIQQGYIGNHIKWWGANRGGYTTQLERAGIYTEQEAKAICRIEGNKMHPAQDVLKVAKLAVLSDDLFEKLKKGGRND